MTSLGEDTTIEVRDGLVGETLLVSSDGHGKTVVLISVFRTKSKCLKSSVSLYTPSISRSE